MIKGLRIEGFRAPGAVVALASAALFGITTPLAKLLLAGSHPLLIAGLLYAGSGLGLSLWILLQDRGRLSTGLAATDWPWLMGAIACGGVAAPALLMFGLLRADAAAASLLLNLEVVFTALIAWLAFGEATSIRIVLGFIAICAGSLLLSWPGQTTAPTGLLPSIAIVAACLLWAIDNNLTRRISSGDARSLAALKGLTAGVTNTSLALLMGATLPSPSRTVATLSLGLVGYGISLMLFIHALRHLGTARTGAYFSTAPFVGGIFAIALFGQTAGGPFWIAASLMMAGVWLHLTEDHCHEHEHLPVTHSHPHTHDIHHRHTHGSDWDGSEPHTHLHEHAPLRHSHPHHPDIHHQHAH